MKNNLFNKRAIALAVLAACSGGAFAGAGDIIVSTGGVVAPANTAISGVNISGTPTNASINLSSGPGPNNLTANYGVSNIALSDSTYVDPITLSTVTKQVSVTVNGVAISDGLGGQISLGQGVGSGNIAASGTVDAAQVTVAYTGGSVSVGTALAATPGVAVTMMKQGSLYMSDGAGVTGDDKNVNLTNNGLAVNSSNGNVQIGTGVGLSLIHI